MTNINRRMVLVETWTDKTSKNEIARDNEPVVPRHRRYKPKRMVDDTNLPIGGSPHNNKRNNQLTRRPTITHGNHLPTGDWYEPNHHRRRMPPKSYIHPGTRTKTNPRILPLPRTRDTHNNANKKPRMRHSITHRGLPNRLNPLGLWPFKGKRLRLIRYAL